MVVMQLGVQNFDTIGKSGTSANAESTDKGNVKAGFDSFLQDGKGSGSGKMNGGSGVKNKSLAKNNVKEMFDKNRNTDKKFDESQLAGQGAVMSVSYAVKELEVSITEDVKEVLKCSEADVVKGLTELNMTKSDLLEEANVIRFVMNMNQIEDTSELLVNQEVYEQFTEINSLIDGLVQEFAGDYGVPAGKVGEFIRQFDIPISDEMQETLKGMEPVSDGVIYEPTIQTDDRPNDMKKMVMENVEAAEITNDGDNETKLDFNQKTVVAADGAGVEKLQTGEDFKDAPDVKDIKSENEDASFENVLQMREENDKVAVLQTENPEAVKVSKGLENEKVSDAGITDDMAVKMSYADVEDEQEAVVVRTESADVEITARADMADEIAQAGSVIQRQQSDVEQKAEQDGKNAYIRNTEVNDTYVANDDKVVYTNNENEDIFITNADDVNAEVEDLVLENVSAESAYVENTKADKTEYQPKKTYQTESKPEINATNDSETRVKDYQDVRADEKVSKKVFTAGKDIDLKSTDNLMTANRTTNSHESSSRQQRNLTQTFDFKNVTANLAEHVDTALAGQPVTESERVSFTSRIMEQVMDNVKVMSDGGLSSMEMQLEPENLGKLSIHVVAKNGVVTAQITAQNEAVKHVLESQVAVLKENLNKQEIKIEDVEVTVASHAFEQGMGNHDSSGNQRQNRRRFNSTQESVVLNENDLKSIKDELLEEAMKEKQGSTVSYTA